MDADARCPCGSGETYRACCAQFHSGQALAPTARALMASRYCAFAVGATDYVRATWHPSTRAADLGVDDGLRWQRLEVLDTVDGGPFDTVGVVEFRAHYRSDAGSGVLHECSRFVRERGRWLYVSGTVSPS